jgi:membrane protease YdiL (CAAX protease family)
LDFLLNLDMFGTNNMAETSLGAKSDRKLFIPIVWVIILTVSLLPDILFRELTGSQPTWLYGSKVGLAVVLLLITLFWKRLRPLWLFAAALLAVYLLDWGINQFYQSRDLSHWLSGFNPFVKNVGSVVIPRLTAGIFMAIIMLVLTGKFERFFLVNGKLDAQAAPIPLIMTRPSTWRILGPAIAMAMGLGLVIFTFAFGKLPSTQSLASVLPLLPFVLLFAASNAFGEEMIYRAPWLSALENPVGQAQALLMTAVYFGIAHYYGVPYGIVGAIMSFIPGWLMGKSMLETRGFTWAWFIHFCMDVVVFFFIALGSINPGG